VSSGEVIFATSTTTDGRRLGYVSTGPNSADVEVRVLAYTLPPMDVHEPGPRFMPSFDPDGQLVHEAQAPCAWGCHRRRRHARRDRGSGRWTGEVMGRQPRSLQDVAEAVRDGRAPHPYAEHDWCWLPEQIQAGSKGVLRDICRRLLDTVALTPPADDAVQRARDALSAALLADYECRLGIKGAVVPDLDGAYAAWLAAEEGR